MRIAPLLAALAVVTVPARAAVEPSEYQLKAAVLYNFALFAEWPAEVGPQLKLCVHGRDPFGPEIDDLQGKPVGHRQISVERHPAAGTLADCQIVFISQSVASELESTVERLRSAPVLTVADSPDAARQGVMLNMAVTRGRISFSANLKAAQQAGLSLSSKLLRLATEVVR